MHVLEWTCDVARRKENANPPAGGLFDLPRKEPTVNRNRSKYREPPGSWGELVIDFGRRIQKKIRGGAGLEEVSRRSRSTAPYCQLAVDFANASDLIKFRAIVEDWSLDRIADELGQSQPVPLWQR
jgi:hypothetical protein